MYLWKRNLQAFGFKDINIHQEIASIRLYDKTLFFLDLFTRKWRIINKAINWRHNRLSWAVLDYFLNGLNRLFKRNFHFHWRLLVHFLNRFDGLEWLILLGQLLFKLLFLLLFHELNLLFDVVYLLFMLFFLGCLLNGFNRWRKHKINSFDVSGDVRASLQVIWCNAWNFW